MKFIFKPRMNIFDAFSIGLIMGLCSISLWFLVLMPILVAASVFLEERFL